jgi:hypothetical protein
MVQFEVQDPEGRALFAHAARTSAYGIASTDYVLGADAAHGDYRLLVALGDTRSEQTVTVGWYERPPFRVELVLARPYYSPGETVEGTVRASSFSAEPVAGAEVMLRAYLHVPERALVATLQGRTDADGTYAFRFGLPSDLGVALADLAVEAEVRDGAGRGSWSGRVAPVAREPLAVDVVAEGGRLRPGIENRVYLLVSTPDGAPVQAAVAFQVADQRVSLRTDAYGLATWSLTPEQGVREVQVQVSARDEQGRGVSRSVTLSADRGPAQVLLRLDRASYRVGEAIDLELFAGSDGAVYLDVVHRDQGQTLSTYVVQLDGGTAALAVDVSPQMVGSVELHAYQVLPDGSLARDSRLAVVRAAAAAAVDVELRPDQATYRPGDEARVALTTTVGGRPTQSALGIAVVDESIYALAERAPSFAKLFFVLDRDPYVPGAASLAARDAQDRAARAAWAKLPAGELVAARSDTAGARRVAQDRAHARLRTLARALGVALLALSAGLWLTVVTGLKTMQTERAAVWRVGTTLVGLAIVILLPATVLLTLGASAMLGPAAGKALLALLSAAWVGDLVFVGVRHVRQGDDLGQIVVLLAAAYGVLAGVLGMVAARGGDPGSWATWIVAVSFAAMWSALLVWAVGLWLQRQRVLALGTVLLVLLLLSLAVLAGALLSSSASVALTVADPRIYAGPIGWLSGCAPAREAPVEATAEVEKEMVVAETVVVEKEIEVTKVVEKEVEVTRVAEVEKEVTKALAEPAPQATLRATATTAAEYVLATPTTSPAEESARPTAPPTPAPELPLPLLGQVAAETIYWVPEAITDAQGRLGLQIPLPDAPTTWRLTVLASTLTGELGEASLLLPVKQK